MTFPSLVQSERLPPIAVTMGEPAGIGGEIGLAAWQRGRADSAPPFFMLDDPARLKALTGQLGLSVPIVEIAQPEETAEVFPKALPVLPVALESPATLGTVNRANAAAVVAAIDRAVELALSGRAAAVVTNPIQKKALYEAGFKQPGHTEYLAELIGRLKGAAAAHPVMMLAGPALRVVPVTVHLPLADAIRQLSSDLIVTSGMIAAQALRHDFGIARPRLAVAGLNPHAGEGGALGAEDKEIVAPSVERLEQMLAPEGVTVTGPHPADSLFHASARERYDAALCMYHDQALIPVKTLDFHRTVNVTLGLPIVRTSPDHGCALDIAGKGIARPDSLMAAIALAQRIARQRQTAAAKAS